MSLSPQYRYINADVSLQAASKLTDQELATLIKANPSGNGSEYAVVDVRDSDFAVSPTVVCSLLSD